MTERKLASLVTIAELKAIPGADLIEAARVKGWDVVVGKGTYKVGDPAVYFEIDSALPVEDPRFAFLEPRGVKTLADGSKAHVLKTIKLRGQISQGLLMTLDELGLDNLEEGDDLTEVLGVQKWEPPMPAGTNIKGNFPTQYASKTDSERVQNMSPRQWAEVQSKEWIATEKVDGTSLTVVCDENGDIIVASRNYIVGEGTVHYNAANTLLTYPLTSGMVVQGEVVGPGIQGNPLKLSEMKLFVFDVWKDRQVLPREVWPAELFAMQVPTIDLPFPATTDEAVEQVNKMKSTINPSVQAEGVVWHTADGSEVPSLGRSTFKAINNQFLLKSKD